MINFVTPRKGCRGSGKANNLPSQMRSTFTADIQPERKRGAGKKHPTARADERIQLAALVLDTTPLAVRKRLQRMGKDCTIESVAELIRGNLWGSLTE